MTVTVPSIDALRRNGAKPHFFGLGFIQLKIEENRRLHFYHPELVGNIPDEELHDHRYDFTSTVLVGEITNELASFTPWEYGDQELSKVSCEPGMPVPETEHPVRGIARQTVCFTTSAGGRYSLAHDQFHRVSAKRCVTLLERGRKVKPFASVIRDTVASPVCPFEVKLTEGRCWEIIADLLGDAGDKPGYHLRAIKKGVLGEASKIIEEAEEFEESIEQGVELMALLELADLQGSIEAYLEKNHPSIRMSDLKTMSDVTRRAFINGRRK